MKKLSDRRLSVLTFIRKQVAVNGQPPTLAEIAKACGLASRGAARKHVLALEEAKLIELTSGQARSARPRGARAPAELLKNPLFEITSRDVSDLGDVALRELAARLCIARLTAKGLPSQFVTWGGDQRAPDGGIDVRVEAPEDIARAAGFERPLAGFQVKDMPMRPAAIQREMCPGGVLRPSIRRIIASGGAYILVSSESVADKGLQERRAAMRAALAAEPDADDCHLDFYDARRLADWTNEYPGVVAWVRGQLGRPLQGWRPHELWVSRDGKEEPFLGDDVPRLIDPTDPEHPSTLIEGLEKVRTLLRHAGSCVRIAGLSGVGKTRFAQALFEARAAENPLEPVLAVYTDMSDSPSPSPQALLDELLANHRRAVLVVDNCSSELHGRLAGRCKTSRDVSLLTIEYDIRDDLPEETNVFRMEPASSELVTKVLEQQFPQLSQVDAQTITAFSEGNSRLALALASTLGKRDSLADVSSDELFRRLFWQKSDESESLLRAAQACSLVYSFDGENELTELPRLAALAGTSVLDLYRSVDMLLRRGLAQKRGPWRAVLPHAVANRLARQALSAIPYPLIDNQLVAGQNRLLRSFSRRLGYLHDSREAREIVRRWFAVGGMLADIAALDELLADVFRNVAPVDPEGALSAIEHACAGSSAEQFVSVSSRSRRSITHLLRSIAWEAGYFERCLDVLLKFALAQPSDHRVDSTQDLIKSMFALHLSGTHATKEQRAAWIRKGLESSDERVRHIAIECLDAALESHHFSSSYTFDFGARHRDYGYFPRSNSEARAWFVPFIELAIEHGKLRTPLGSRMRDLLAGRFRGLWSVVGQYDMLEIAVAKLMDRGWERGWLAIKQTQRFDSERMREEGLRRLLALEKVARPRSLVDQTKAVVLAAYSSAGDVSDAEEEDGDGGMPPHEKADRKAEDLGTLVARDAQSFAALLPSLVENRQGRHWRFGAGLAKGAEKPEEIWQALVGAFGSADSEVRGIMVLIGFLAGINEIDRPLYERLLDQALEAPILAEWLPALQISAKLDTRGCDRLIRSLALGVSPTARYKHLAYGSVTSALPEDDISRLVRSVAAAPDGVGVAADILAMYLYGKNGTPGAELQSAGRDLLARMPLPSQDVNDHLLELLVTKCLAGPESEPAARDLLHRIREGLNNYSLSLYQVGELVSGLFAVHPVASLDELVGDEPDKGKNYSRRRDLASAPRNPLHALSVQALVDWCRTGSEQRWRNAAAAIPKFAAIKDENQHTSWSDMAIALIKAAPKVMGVISTLVDRIPPNSWSGSRAAAMSVRLPLFDQLDAYVRGDDLLKLRQLREHFERTIDRERTREAEERETAPQGFE